MLTGASAVYNHNNIQNSAENHYLSWRAYHDLYSDKKLAATSHITVTCFNYVMLIAGQVPDLASRYRAESLVRQIPGIKKVVNQITIGPVTSPVVQTNDLWLTTQINAQIIATNDIDPHKIKVTTENSTVYLMGTVTRLEANTVVNIAKYTYGVQKVVKVFQYLRLESA